MSPEAFRQPVRAAEPLDEARRREGPAWRRIAIAGPAGLALLLAGGGMLIRAATLTFHGRVASGYEGWVLTATACVLGGVALLLITLPKVVLAERGDRGPAPVPHG